MEFFALPAAQQAEFERLTSIFEVEEEHLLDADFLLPTIYES
ncbi:hypothetical protein CKALI_03440 [Corynebacterium kalinowskii]|uniref:Uncharacterized protein n=1 Tax=Corynebacterium kalinowskii TaxID=2675216 RepID=A0A6B8VP44_9CORY|nr:hypothetical protein [Corynebacterium kalinowskii]QGU01571.1 hypothetical protein CKALI_03440 [Corynebacterium kalinowskii]